MPAEKSVLLVNQSDVEAGLREVGLDTGDIALVHSSLSSMGHVQGGAETVVDAFLGVLDPGHGTFVLPTLCQKELARRRETWDPAESPSDVGRITEIGRRRPGALRSDHFSHSVAAIGNRAAELVAGHAQAHGRPSPWGPAAFGVGSPWEKLYEWNAHYLFLGVDFSVNTIGHFAQSVFVAECLEQAGPRREEFALRLRGWERPGVWPSFPFAAAEDWLQERGQMRYARIGNALLRATCARADVDAILERLRSQPEQLLPADFLEWHDEIRSARA